jgi:hypothetical protein
MVLELLASLVLSYFQYPRNMWAASRTSSLWVSPERAMPIMGQTVPYYVTACCIRSFSTVYNELLWSAGDTWPPQNQTDSRGSSVSIVITWRPGLDWRMQVRYLTRAESVLFSASYLVARVKQTGTWTLTIQFNLIFTPSEPDASCNTDTTLNFFSFDTLKIKFPHIFQ